MNKSLINGLWEQECTNNEYCNGEMSQLYFSKGKALARRWERFEINFFILKNKLTLELYQPRKKASAQKLDFEILKLDRREMILLHINRVNGETDTMMFRRKEQVNNEKFRNLSIAHDGLENLEIEIGSNSQCRTAHINNENDELKTSMIPTWKTKALKLLCKSVKLKSSVGRYDTSVDVCGGDFVMIIEVKNKKLYQYFQPDDNANDLGFVTSLLWELGSETMLKGKKEKGRIKHHKQLMGLFRQIPTQEKTLQFIPN